MPDCRSLSRKARFDRRRSSLASRLTQQHLAIARGERSASEPLAETLVPILIARVAARFPRVDPSTRLQAVHDALLWYLRRPDRYRPECARLDVFLGRVVECRLKDALRSEMRKRRREIPVDPAALECADQCSAVDFHLPDAWRDLRLRLLAVVRSRTERVFIDAYLKGASESRLARILRFRSDAVESASQLIHRVVKRLHQRAIRMSSRGACVKPMRANE